MTFTSLVEFVRNDWTTWPSWFFFGEGLLIVVGNAVTIAVFWKRRNLVKRASCLLINLAVANLFVGVALLTNKAVSFSRSETLSRFLLIVSGILVSLFELYRLR